MIAALLTLGLAFAAFWILYYVEPGGDPRALLPWFAGAAAVIMALAFLAYVRRGGGGGAR